MIHKKVLSMVNQVQLVQIDFDAVLPQMNLDFFEKFRDVTLLLIMEPENKNRKAICIYPKEADAYFGINSTARNIIGRYNQKYDGYHVYAGDELIGNIQRYGETGIQAMLYGGGVVGMSAFTLKKVSTQEAGKSLLEKFTL